MQDIDTFSIVIFLGQGSHQAFDHKLIDLSVNTVLNALNTEISNDSMSCVGFAGRKTRIIFTFIAFSIISESVSVLNPVSKFLNTAGIPTPKS